MPMRKEVNYTYETLIVSLKDKPNEADTLMAAEVIEKALMWANMSRSEMRLRAGELTDDEIRTVRAVLSQIPVSYTHLTLPTKRIV